MARGGKREGAGRKVGSVSKHAKLAKEVAQQAVGDGITPLAYLLSIMRDEERADDMRLDAAKAAAPYVHPRLATTEVKGDPNAPQHHQHTVVWKITDAGKAS